MCARQIWITLIVVALLSKEVYADFSQHLRSSHLSQDPSERQLILTMRSIISRTLGDREEKKINRQKELIEIRKNDDNENDEVLGPMCTEDTSHVHVFYSRVKSNMFRESLGFSKVSGILRCVNRMAGGQEKRTKKQEQQHTIVTRNGSGNSGGNYDDLSVPLGVTIFIVAIPGISILMIFAMMLISCYFSKTGASIRRFVCTHLPPPE